MRYVQKSFKAAAELNWAEPYDGMWEEALEDIKDGWSDFSYQNGIWEVEDEIGYRFVGSDGGEPEDQTMKRDWAWVVDELNKAYLQGIYDAKEQLIAIID